MPDKLHIESNKIRSFLVAIDEQDAVLLDQTKGKGSSEVSMAQSRAIAGIFQDIRSYSPELVRPYEFYGQAAAVRAQLRAARARLNARLSELAVEIDESSKGTTQMTTEAPDKRRVFVVHGRNQEAHDALFLFLRVIGLDPIEWEEAIAMTGQGTPYIGAALDVAFSNAQAASFC